MRIGPVAAIILTALLGFSVTLAVAGAYEDAEQIFYKDMGERGLTHMRALADQGDDRAQMFIGFQYEVGQGLVKSGAEAVAWYRKAAAQGNLAAQFRLGEVLTNFSRQWPELPQDLREAEKWYRVAAERVPIPMKAPRHSDLMAPWVPT